jgi:multisubunit Na+/H+ antiporter MnhC subunit
MLTQGALVLFMSLKTLVEAGMYMLYRKRIMKKLTAEK